MTVFRDADMSRNALVVHWPVGGSGRQAAGHTISFAPSQIPRIKIKSLRIPAQPQWGKLSLSENSYPLSFGKSVVHIFRRCM